MDSAAGPTTSSTSSDEEEEEDSKMWTEDDHIIDGEGSGPNGEHESRPPGRQRIRAWADTALNFETILHAEQKLIDYKFRARQPGGQSRPAEPFSVAFSGGGVRAAAFQAGVLWRLAQEGVLRDVEHFVAVSGGAYVTSSLSSHLVAAKRPEGDEDVDAFYRRAVAKTICRMQRNIGYFVRDWGHGALTVPQDGSGPLPPIADVPVLLAVIVFTVLSNPLTYLVVYVIPLTECVNYFMGMAMRAAYCAPTETDAWRIFEWWGPLHLWLWNVIGLLLFTFAAWLLGKCPPCVVPKNRKGDVMYDRAGKEKPIPQHMGFLYLQSLRAATTRILVILTLIIVILCGIMSTELWDGVPLLHNNQTRIEFCREMITGNGEYQPQCDDMRQDATGHWGPWWDDPMFDVYRVASGNMSRVAQSAPSRTWAKEVEDVESTRRETRLLKIFAMPFQQSVVWSGSSLFISMIVLLLAVLGVALVLSPIFKGLFLFCLSLVGPTVAVFLSASFMQYRIFGPLTGQYYVRLLSLWPFSRTVYVQFRLACLVVAFVLMVFFHAIHFASHYFYTRSLRLAYFDGGKDLTWRDLHENPFCPLVLFTGTVTDWKRPGDRDGISEISITALHTGSSKTGYVATPPWRSVAKCTALAAAATDAFILGMMDRLRYRFWLEFLNLRMGDYILFERRRNPCVSWCQKRMPPCRRESFFFYEFPVVALGGVAFLLFISASFQSQSDDEARCRSAYHMYVASLYTVITIFFLSFFAFIPFLEFFVHSPMVRQIHMAMRYYHVSETPPSMVYVSDGGVQDCTGILQLMRRRSKRILLALAASDPDDDLSVLRETIRIALQLQIGSFYDPKDPRVDVSMLLDEFKENKSQTFLHLGIRYGWDRGEYSSSAAGDGEADARMRRKTGSLFVVKNRVPPECGAMNLEPSITEPEIADGPRTRNSRLAPMRSESSSGVRSGSFSFRTQDRLTQQDLGGCCCDFCHVFGCNLGPKFPHVSNANQCLTPQLFSSLCRLGHRVSKEAILKMTSGDQGEEPWEQWVR